MDNASIQHSRWNCTFHIVFIPKWRRKIMYGENKKDILGRPIKVTKVKGQVELRSPELGGRKIRLDVKAVEANGDRINIEVQGDSTGSSVKRARYHSSMIDSRMLKKSQDFDEIKDSYVIFIYEHDKFKKGLPIYHLERFVEETGEKVGDGSHIIYVNGNYKGKDDIGKLIEDFKCKDSSKMHFKELADGVKYYKETEEGREIMCEAVVKYGDKRAEKEKENTKIEIFLNMIKDGIPKEKAQKLAAISDALVEKALGMKKA